MSAIWLSFLSGLKEIHSRRLPAACLLLCLSDLVRRLGLSNCVTYHMFSIKSFLASFHNHIYLSVCLFQSSVQFHSYINLMVVINSANACALSSFHRINNRFQFIHARSTFVASQTWKVLMTGGPPHCFFSSSSCFPFLLLAYGCWFLAAGFLPASYCACCAWSAAAFFLAAACLKSKAKFG
jgi:hypothetical protein